MAAAAAPPVEPSSSSENAHITSVSTGVLVLLVIIWSLLGHKAAARSQHLMEGSAACLLGLATGVVLLTVHISGSRGAEVAARLLEFNAGSFFTYLLPPIIFYCGLSVEKHRFFLNLPSILLFGIVGTLMSFVITGVFLYLFLGFTMFKLQDALAMGAIFAATDSVATLQVLDASTMPTLFSIVFGEGVVNDAVSVVLLGAIDRSTRDGAWTGGWAGFIFNFLFLLVSSFTLGALAGLGIAFVLKTTKFVGPHQELAVIGLLAYSSWLVADLMGLSAILALFVCGLLVSHYALHNVSSATTLNAFRTLAYVSEGMVFIYVGMDCLDPQKWKASYLFESIWLVMVLSVLLVVARAVFVVPFSILHNLMPHADKLSRRDVIIVWWSGLMRGAVSVALVYLHFDSGDKAVPTDRHRATLIVSTLTVVMLSITGVGALTKPLMRMLLRDDGDRMLEAQLRNVPLLGHTYQRITSHTHLGFDSLPATHSHPPPAGHNTSRPSGHGLSITAEVDPECASHPEGACEAPVGPPGTHHQPFNDPQQPRTPGQGDADGHGPGVGGTTGGGCNGGSSSGGSGGGGGAVQLQVMGGGGGTPGAFRPSSSLEDAQRRLPLPIRSLVDRLQHFDRDVMMPVFTRTPEEQQQQQQQQASQSPQQPKFTLT